MAGPRLPEAVRVGRGGTVEVLGFARYVAAALTAETTPEWASAALEAQAVACRSYAAHMVGHPRAPDHDVVASSGDQVLDLRPDPPAPVAAALAATAGQVLVAPRRRWARPTPVKALFHAACGGGTDDPRAVWPGSRLHGLRGVDCPPCRQSLPWRAEVPLAAVLAGVGLPDAPAREVSFATRRSPSGRQLELVVTVGRRRRSVTAEQLRRLVGFDRLRSARFDHRVADGVVCFEGVGHGHGVGLCQRGAKAMAEQGAGAAEILRHYYPGAEVVAGQ